MTIFLTIIFTTICWQLLCTIVDLITDDNIEKVGVVAFGIWIPIFLFISFIVKKVNLWRNRKYNCYQIFGKRSLNNSFGGWLTNVYMTKEVADKYFSRQFGKDEDVTQDYAIRLLREGKEFNSPPPKSDILTAELIEVGIPALSAEFLKKYRE